MVAYYLLMLLIVAIPVAFWAVPTYLSFRLRSPAGRRFMAAASGFLSGVGALGVFAYTAVDDFNDYPGYTCLGRDVPELDDLRADRYPPPESVAATPGSDLSWSHAYELFPVGMRCTHWVPGSPELTVITHSHWVYTLLFYGLAAVAVLQVFRCARSESGVNQAL